MNILWNFTRRFADHFKEFTWLDSIMLILMVNMTEVMGYSLYASFGTNVNSNGLLAIAVLMVKGAHASFNLIMNHNKFWGKVITYPLEMSTYSIAVLGLYYADWCPMPQILAMGIALLIGTATCLSLLIGIYISERLGSTSSTGPSTPTIGL